MEKTSIFLVFIFIGILLRFKMKSDQELLGIKKIILDLALPSTIFIALLKIQFESSLLLLPILALGFNFILYLIVPHITKILKIEESKYRNTALLIVPSLAPGLSCFPFVAEFLGPNFLAQAAMADLGNKVFVLVILYFVAMKLFHRNNKTMRMQKKRNRIDFVKALILEPVNLFILTALFLILLNIDFHALPFLFQEILIKLSYIMTPLILIFIGLSLKIKQRQFFQIISLLAFRASISFFIVALFMGVTGYTSSNQVILFLVFSLSACSFWPYAHISLVEEQEKKNYSKTFDSQFAIGILALSFPFSTTLILGILNTPETFQTTPTFIISGLLLFSIGCLYPLSKYILNKTKTISFSNPEFESSDSN